MKIYMHVRTAIFIGLAIALLIFLEPFVESLRYFIGALMVFYGAEEIVYTFFKEKKHYSVRSLYWNLVEILIGITLLALIKEEGVALVVVVCVAWGTWSILRETREMVEATEEIKEKITAIPNILESLVVIVFSVLMITEPSEHHAKTHMYLLFAELVTKVLFPYADMLFERLRHKRSAAQAHGEEPAELEAAATEEESKD